MEYSIKDLDELISVSIKDCGTLPRICKFSSTKTGAERIHKRVKTHVLVGSIDNIDTALALVEQELESIDINSNY